MPGDHIYLVMVRFTHIIPWFLLLASHFNHMAIFISRSQSSVGSKVKAEMTNCKRIHICTHREELCLKESLKKKERKEKSYRRLTWRDIKPVINQPRTICVSCSCKACSNNKKPLASSFTVFLYLLTLMTSDSWALLLEKQF